MNADTGGTAMARNVKLLTLLFFLTASVLSIPVQAQVQRTFLNPGFEQPALTTPGCRVYINESQVPGWTTTHPAANTENSGGCVVAGGLGTSPGPILEIWRTPRNSASGGTVTAPEGVQIAELNATVPSRIYQNVCLINGEQVNWRFSHRGRGSSTVHDVAEMKVGATSAIVRVGTTNTGARAPITISQGTASGASVPGNTTWARYTGSFQYAGATGVTNIGFESISAAGGATQGNLLDDIQIAVAPFVEFTAPSSSAVESTSNLAMLRVNGTVATAFNITVLITGGTATLGTDYTTPGNSTTLTVNVPAGTYDGVNNGLFSLPVTIVNDTDSEQNETIEFSIQPPPGSNPPFLLASSTTCGGAAQTTSTHTILDDDGSIVLSKSASSPVAVTGSPATFDIVYTIVVTNPSAASVTYTLQDTPAFDPDVTILSATSVRTTSGGGTGGGSASLTLTGSGPWNLTGTNRTLNGSSTDTYTITVRFQIGSSGSAANDACGSPGNGLYNTATATRVGGGNPSYSATACRNTPTPVWVTLNKQLQDRATATDQVEIRMVSGGIPIASAVTSGTGAPTTATTGQIVLQAGATLQFAEAVRANGSGSPQAPDAYAKALTCSNATAGSPTVLPSGSGVSTGTSQEWPEFTPAAGDVLTCTITNTPSADLRITKTNTPGINGNVDQADDTVTAGGTTAYTIRVTNNGPAGVTGAVLIDPAATGLIKTAVACSPTPGQCTAGTTPTVAQLESGYALPTLANGQFYEIVVTATVMATGP